MKDFKNLLEDIQKEINKKSPDYKNLSENSRVFSDKVDFAIAARDDFDIDTNLKIGITFTIITILIAFFASINILGEASLALTILSYILFLFSLYFIVRIITIWHRLSKQFIL